jgi:S-methylmethionine-dependent homocysteine/selenocysteine methylase
VSPQLFLGAHLHDGSEYTGSYENKVSVGTIKKWHKVRIQACIEAGVDGLAIETIPCLVGLKNLVDKWIYLFFEYILDGGTRRC